MQILDVKQLAIPEVEVIKFKRFVDNRGYFTETYRKSDFGNLFKGDDSVFSKFDPVQANESVSKTFVMRGLHFQWNPWMGKLVRTICGHMIDIVLDIRQGSPTYGYSLMYDMPSSVTDDTGEWIWVPVGFAHGNLFLEETQIEYLCTGEYSQGNEACINLLSKDINWSLCDSKLYETFSTLIESGKAIISDKDQKGIQFCDWVNHEGSKYFIY